MRNKIRQAFILSAGLGTRLRPITDKVPKVMAPIAEGKPLLEHTIESLRDQGIKDFVLNLHYLPEIITSHFGNGSKLGVSILYSDETNLLLETGGALKKAAPMLDDEFLLIYGDELYFFKLKPLFELHDKTDGLSTVVLKQSDIPANGDVVEFDPETHKVVGWYPRPHGFDKFGANMALNDGIRIISKEILKYITEPEGIPVKLDAQVFPRAMEAGESFYALLSNEPIIDIGTPEKYELAKAYYKEAKSKHLS